MNTCTNVGTNTCAWGQQELNKIKKQTKKASEEEIIWKNVKQVPF